LVFIPAGAPLLSRIINGNRIIPETGGLFSKRAKAANGTVFAIKKYNQSQYIPLNK